ncbi:hypothetical protein LSH36_204g09016 [Paralvinella palmiformis]|uniref:Uncharacterized protein n=1 Tax=Paralvinella palmiformis TaxID=53620 RepID=A0AAD9JQ20_9ANNE|nr:hypothetical protein LSH36_204g09016 [Paralvinella palmiformis]
MPNVHRFVMLVTFILVVLAVMATAFPLDLPVVRRAYFGAASSSQSRPMLCGKDDSQYVKCYLCGKQLSDGGIFERCCNPSQYTEIDYFCGLITGGPY